MTRRACHRGMRPLRQIAVEGRLKQHGPTLPSSFTSSGMSHRTHRSGTHAVSTRIEWERVFGWRRETSTGCPRRPALLPLQASSHVIDRPTRPTASGPSAASSRGTGHLEVTSVRPSGDLRTPPSATRHSDRRTCRVQYTATVYGRWPSGRGGDGGNQKVRRSPHAPARWSRRGARAQQPQRTRSRIARRVCGSILIAGRRSRTSRPLSAGQWLTISVSWLRPSWLAPKLLVTTSRRRWRIVPAGSWRPR
jgi:hypothetical protein